MTARGSVTLPANVQYVWPNVSRRFLYAATSSRGSDTAPTGTVHYVSAFRIDPASGALARHGDPIPLPAKPRRRTTPHSSVNPVLTAASTV